MKQITAAPGLPKMPAIAYDKDDCIAAIVSSPTIRIHKSWRLVFIIMIILIKALLGFCAYLYIKAEMNQPPAITQQPIPQAHV